MKTPWTLRIALVAGLAGWVQAQDFTTYISIGDSQAAGFSSGALVDTDQANSVPALLAKQGAAPDFQQPLISEPGIPAQLALQNLIPVVIGPKSASTGVPENLLLARPYNNLAVPGATASDALNDTGDPSAGGLAALILRGKGSQVAQGAFSRPTFITLWIGNNDVLAAAVRGQAIEGVTLTPVADFRATYTTIIAALKATGAPIVAANLGDVTTIPFVTTIPPVVVNPNTNQPILVDGNPVPLIGPNGPLPPGTLVTLAASSLLAQGIGIPTQVGGTGDPLPDEVILDAGEVAIIQDHVNNDNAAIADICQKAGVPVVDLHAVLNEFSTTGRNVGGVQLSSTFLTGGIFGYDGIHPTPLGYAVVANEFINVINQNGGTLPLIDLSPFLGVGTASASSVRPRVEFSEAAYRSLLQVFPLVGRRR